MSTIKFLCRDEPLRLDPERLATLYVDMGEHRAQRVVGRALEDLSDTLDEALGQFRAGSLSGLCTCADHIERLAEPLGLSCLAGVAADVGDLCDGSDHVALAATVSRMERVANKSLKTVWMLRDMSG